jgi:hypothetical protein
MEYAQLNIAQTEALQITTHGDVDWDSTHYCPASALTPDEAALFRVVPLIVVDQPAFNPITQSVMRNGCELVGGEWRYKWRIDALSAVAVTANLASAKVAAVDRIKAERDRRKLNGVKVGAQWIHSDTYSRTQWLGMVIMGASVPAIEWTTMDGSTVTTSQALAGQVFNGTAMLDSTLFSHASALIAQVEAAPDPATVDITAGWPATFEAV